MKLHVVEVGNARGRQALMPSGRSMSPVTRRWLISVCRKASSESWSCCRI